MSLSIKDDQKIAELFSMKEACDKDSHEYYKYRDAIFTHVLENLKDYFAVLKQEWKSKFKMSDEDAISIIHDGLLSAVNNFQPGYRSRKRVTKFLTYFVHILKNNVKNYITLNYVGEKRAKRNFHKMPLNAYTSLDQLITFSQEEIDLNDQPFGDKRYTPILRHLSDKYEYFESQQNRDFFMEHMLHKLSETDRRIIKYILDGYDLKEVAASVNMTTVGIKYRLRRLAQKFSIIEKELCR